MAGLGPGDRWEAIGNTPTMSDMPAATLYHRWLGWHALELRRAGTVLVLGLLVALALMVFVTWRLALVGGWHAAALAFLLTAWSIIGRADSSRCSGWPPARPPTWAASSTVLLKGQRSQPRGREVSRCVGRDGAPARRQVLLTAWPCSRSCCRGPSPIPSTCCATPTALRCRGTGAWPSATRLSRTPDYRDFAYVAFTIGMTYQVSDTALRHPRPPTHRTRPRAALLPVRRGHRGRFGEPDLRARSLTPPDPAALHPTAATPVPAEPAGDEESGAATRARYR